MGFSFRKAFGTGKLHKKLFGKSDRGSWGYFRKKIGLKNPFSFDSSTPVNSASSVYGHTGSIVGKF